MTAIDLIEEASGATWNHIREARQRALEENTRLNDALSSLAPDDSSVIVFGSLARQEYTAGSDIDWTLLIDGQANPQHFNASQDIERTLHETLGISRPGREGTFGGLSFSHDILHKIGGSDDSNTNTTQRLLLLLESAPIGNTALHTRLTRALLKRYISEDFGWIHRTVTVPRFLLNDIARYWRTVAVDFAYKRRQRSGSGWALRTVKLRMSRKMVYASGLLACFTPALGFLSPDDASSHESDRVLQLVALLSDVFAKTPLERIALVGDKIPGLREVIGLLFSAYDEYLAMLADTATRSHLEQLSPESAGSDAVYEQARHIGHRFQNALSTIFFDLEETGIPDLTREYGVF